MQRPSTSSSPNKLRTKKEFENEAKRIMIITPRSLLCFFFFLWSTSSGECFYSSVCVWAVFNYKLRWRSPNLAPHPKIEFLCDREHPGWRAATPPTGAMGNCINRVQSTVETVSPLSLFSSVFGEHDAGLFGFVKKVSVEVRYALLGNDSLFLVGERVLCHCWRVSNFYYWKWLYLSKHLNKIWWIIYGRP